MRNDIILCDFYAPYLKGRKMVYLHYLYNIPPIQHFLNNTDEFKALMKNRLKLKVPKNKV